MLLLPDHPGPPSLVELQNALAAAGEEDERWEAKGPGVDGAGIAKAVAALANHDGGTLVLGVESEAGGWTVVGLDPVGDREPGRWIADVVADAMAPVPRTRTLIVPVGVAGRWAAVVVVEALMRDLAVLNSGRVLVRHHGRTSPVRDGSTLTALVLRRAGVGVPARLDAALPADELADEVARAVRSDDLTSLPALLARLRTDVLRAARFDPDPGPTVDRLVAVAATVAGASDDPARRTSVIRALHSVFDAGRQLRGPVNARHDLDLFRVLRPDVLALGGMLVRLERWDAARALAAHVGPELAGAPRGWMPYIDAVQADVVAGGRNAEVRRHPVRAAREATARLRALRPDHADEHVALDSVLTFDAVVNLVEVDTSDRDGRLGQVWPDFALFAPDAVRPLFERILLDSDVRTHLLPGRDDRATARLLVQLDHAAARVMPEVRNWHGAFTPAALARLRSLGVP